MMSGDASQEFAGLLIPSIRALHDRIGVPSLPMHSPAFGNWGPGLNLRIPMCPFLATLGQIN